MKVAVIGGNGQLGAEVVRAFAEAGNEAVALTHEDVEIAELPSVVAAFDATRPDLVVNTAAMHHVEACERDPSRAFAVNALGARNLALLSRDRGVALMHVSTDYVFDGARRTPYAEDDLPRPLNVYGNTKLSGEHFIEATAEKYFILRTSGLYGRHPCRAKGRDFVELMLKLARERGRVSVVDDEELTPTSTAALAAQIVALARTEAYGLIHATASGSCTWYAFAREIFRLGGVPVELRRAEPGEFPAKVPRPAYSVLDNRRLAALGLDVLGTWQDGLARHLGAGVHV